MEKKQLKSVLLSGVPGLLVGSAGELYAENAVISESVDPDDLSTDDVEPDIEDIDGQSFGEAFAEARAELGPGGVFEWHGNLYSTYYAEEWAAMDAESREEYFSWALNGIEPDSESDIHPDDDPDDVVDCIYGPPPADDDEFGIDDPVYEVVYGSPDYFETTVDNMD